MFLDINEKMNITLCGMMGSGKSAVGKLLAKNINFNFIDVDKLIEIKTNKSISRIFAEEGESYFRNLEEKITIKELKNKKTILSLGGGAIINTLIRKSIKENSYNIYLKVSNDVLEKRLKYSKNRPLIIKKNLTQTISDLIKKREKYYRNADLIIRNEVSITETVEEIIGKIINE